MYKHFICTLNLRVLILAVFWRGWLYLLFSLAFLQGSVPSFVSLVFCDSVQPGPHPRKSSISTLKQLSFAKYLILLVEGDVQNSPWAPLEDCSTEPKFYHHSRFVILGLLLQKPILGSSPQRGLSALAPLTLSVLLLLGGVGFCPRLWVFSLRCLGTS